MEQRGNPAPAQLELESKPKRGPDSIIPSRMFDEGIWYNLTSGEKDAYVTIRRHANHIGLTMMTLPGLRKRCGFKSRQGLRKCLDGLQEKGALYRHFKPGDFMMNSIRAEAPPNTWVFYT